VISIKIDFPSPSPVSWTTASIPDLSGRLALVTGASSGLGLETCRALAAHGATVVMACRSRQRGEAARQALLTAPGGGSADPGSGGPGNGTAAAATPDHTPAEAASPWGALDLLDLDLADLASVRSAATEVADRYGRLDLLINNAGVMAPPRTLSRDGFELQFATNHLGHFVLTLLLLPLLRQSPAARVVHVTSGAQYFGRIAFDDLQGERRYDRWSAYSQSKLANVMTAVELQRRLEAEGSGVLSLAAHPGLARTNLQPTSVAMNGSPIEAFAYRLMGPLFQSAAMGALPQLYAATAPEATPAGHYGPDQLGGMKGYPTPVRMAPAAQDASLRKRLWQVSEELGGVVLGDAALTLGRA
jgi:protochlorophyllide reductase